ncbi:hypothetical protein [Psychrobacter sp. I-STPA10]|uniref:hypothetical protein n=1 Tax=Psychrobacter sp. I-STPA10 TaxID=2585769 RepID=UPI001E39AE6F|nr:hypothetical protein [Psychrobacter sp. I-STPA10]
MNQQYAIYKIEFIYDGEWYYFNPDNQNLYEIITEGQNSQQCLAGLEREKLVEYDLERLRNFGNGDLSEEQYQAIVTFIKEDCGLALYVEEDGYFDADDIPVDDMSDEQLLQFLQLAQSNHYILKAYVASPPRYVLWADEQGYITQDPYGYSDSVWFTFEGSNVIEQYCQKNDFYEDKDKYKAQQVDDRMFAKINQNQ